MIQALKYQVKPGYSVKAGNYNELMPKVKKNGLPMGITDVMKAIVSANTANSTNNIIFEDYIRTVDGVACHKGEVKIVHNAEELINITPSTKLNSNGLLDLSKETYAALDGPTLHKENPDYPDIIIGQSFISGRSLTEGEIRDNSVWQTLANKDWELLGKFTSYTVSETIKQSKAKGNKDLFVNDRAMSFYLSPEQDRYTMGCLSLCNIVSGHMIYGNTSLDSIANLVWSNKTS